MTALAAERWGSFEIWNYRLFTLLSGKIAYKGGAACLQLSSGKVVPAAPETANGDLIYIGHFEETVDASAGDKPVNVNLDREIKLRWLDNSQTAAVTAVGSLCYFEDDQTVTSNPAGAAVAGRVWRITSVDGVLVEKLSVIPDDSGLLKKTALAAFTAANINVGDNPQSGAVFDVPTTAANSTITLPAAAVEGTRLTFVADGTKNGHTVQYRDATGPVSLTAALTASKRHQVSAVFLNGIWTANAYVAP